VRFGGENDSRSEASYKAFALATLLITGAVAAQNASEPVIDVSTKAPDPITGAPRILLKGSKAGANVDVSLIRTAPDGLPPAFRRDSPVPSRGERRDRSEVESAPLSA